MRAQHIDNKYREHLAKVDPTNASGDAISRFRDAYLNLKYVNVVSISGINPAY
jgi:hypothetical protein